MIFVARIAWRNLWRHGRRSLITASAMAVGISLCMAMFAFNDGIYEDMFEVMVEQSLGHVQVHHPDWPGARAMFSTLSDADALVTGLEALPDTAAVAPRLYGFALVGGEDTAAGALVGGVDPVREGRVTPLPTKVVEGRWLSVTPAREVVLGRRLATDLDVAVGDSVVVVAQAADGSTGNDLYTVVGLVRTGSTQVDRSGAFLHLDDLRALLVLEGKLHEVALLAKDERVAELAAAARGALGDGVLVRTWWEASPSTAQMLEVREAATFLMLGIVFSVAALGVLNTMMMSVFERTQELGVLQALGLRPVRLVLLVVTESVFLAALSCAIGLVAGGLLDLYLVVYGIDFSSAVSGMDFGGFSFEPVVKGVVRPDGVVRIVVAVFAVSVAASLWPAVRAARLDPVHAIRQV